jgi:hypothetical protein
MGEHRLTADKREIKDFPKLPLSISFIRNTLYEIAAANKANTNSGEQGWK